MHIRALLRRSDELNFKLTIISFTNKPEFCQEYLESVVEKKYFDRVEFLIDADRRLYRGFGFDWKLGQGVMKEPKKLGQGGWQPFIMKEYALAHQSVGGTDYNSPAKKMIDFSYEDFVFRKYVKNDDPLQQGGDVILDMNGKLVKIFGMDNVTDRPDVDVVLA